MKTYTNPPKNCDVCGETIATVFVDGKTYYGPWGIMCENCSPKNCDVCGETIATVLVDGKTCYGPWGIMCENCFDVFGVGLGTGLGQKYQKQVIGGKELFVKIEG